jgi:hypothetical protein
MSAAAAFRAHLDIKEGEGVLVASTTDDRIQMGHWLTHMELSSTWISTTSHSSSTDRLGQHAGFTQTWQ